MTELILIAIAIVMIRGLIIVITTEFWFALFMMIVLTPLFLVWILFRGIFG